MKKKDFMESTRLYVENLRKIIKSLEKDKPKDRLEYATSTAKCFNSVLMSIKGWSEWMSHLEMLNTLTLEDFQTAYPKIKQATIDFLKIDIETTSKKLVEATVKLKTNKRKEKTEKEEISYTV